MAGSYDDAPSRRMAYDADGSVVTYWHLENGGLGDEQDWVPQRDLTLAQKQNLNTEESRTTNTLTTHSLTQADRYISWVFPQRREIDGVFSNLLSDFFSSSAGAFQYSTNSTGGRDGSWTTDIANVDDFYDSTYTTFRDNITSAAINNAAAVRQQFLASVSNAFLAAQGQYHIYGTIAPGENPNRLVFLDTGNADVVFTRVLDYGDVPRGQTSVRTIKVKNISSQVTISGVSLSAEDLYLDGATFLSFSLTDSTYEDPLTLSSFGPGVEKVVYVKQQVPDGATAGLQTARMKLSHTGIT